MIFGRNVWFSFKEYCLLCSLTRVKEIVHQEQGQRDNHGQIIDVQVIRPDNPADRDAVVDDGETDAGVEIFDPGESAGWGRPPLEY